MTLGSHQRCVGKSQQHLTPRWLLEPLGAFDLDPCAADPRPWGCAPTNYTEADDGLSREWFGRVWLNPPFDRYVVGEWMRRFFDHGSGIALLHARTETEWFRPVWGHAWAVLFLGQRVKFCRTDGTEQKANSGAPVVLIAANEFDAAVLRDCQLHGAFVDGWITK